MFRHSRDMGIMILAGLALAALPAIPAWAGVSEEDMPATSIVPAASTAAGAPSPTTPAMPPVPAMPAAEAGAAAPGPPPALPAPEAVPPPAEAGAAAAHPAKPKSHKLTAADREVEPANARLKLAKDDWVYTDSSKWSKHIERVHAGKFVVVTGATRAYLQVKLRGGVTGYLDPSAVDLVKPTDKVFKLTSNADVRDMPNRWAKKVSEVHKGYEVHAVGVSLNYVKIKMRSGLEGFIPLTALE